MEEKLRNQVKVYVREYYKKVHGHKKVLEYIPPSGKLLGEEELLNMIDASLDMHLTAGRFNKTFESKFARYLDVKYAISTNSGSSANLLALSALTSYTLGERRLNKGDEVISVAATFPTTINPIFQYGLVPVFVDCELGTYNIDAHKIEEAISPKTKAIFLAHTLGNSYDLDKVMHIANKYNLWVIEDSCDALGGEFKGKKLGSVGHIGTFSFYPAHHITMGEGGAVVTNDSKLHKLIMSFRDWGRDCICPPARDGVCGKRFSQQLGNLPYGYDHKYTYSHIGYNLKITDWQAALGCAQIDRLESFLNSRRKNAELLTKLLCDLQDYLILPKVAEGVNPSWFGYAISIKKTAPFTKQELVSYLEYNKIGTRELFAGNILRQPMIVYDDVNFRIGDSKLINSQELNSSHYELLPNTDFIMDSTFWIGTFQALGDVEITKMASTIRKFVDAKTKRN
ncbi:lipopolysaccharide biosynthesis protein RfbH [Helicobacter sp. 11S02629-2]|uniref:lipopolysaccharide biosynthesis protein RfbH n=1 Tax=Helicobacter sp. 11S02629-2 TaxID=1476195 RepID=UPI000BA6293C|nr:lipopolysaccharide biosynthesis protein RfbH [Helicobacter sp. 11S02629-2]PAF44657.1 lipopolysaccharide biosynthesis protein RfbH [Helicobacter sp. 11S02629-2]